VVNLHTALFHHFFKLAVADRIRHVPAGTPQDDVPFKMAALELDRHRPVPQNPPLASIRQAATAPKFATEPPELLLALFQRRVGGFAFAEIARDLRGLRCKLAAVVASLPTGEVRAVRWPGFRA
jgi:hypothetical protein